MRVEREKAAFTTVRNAAAVFFPLDQRLNLQEHSWTPETIEGALRMSIEVPSYRRAADHLSGLTHVTCAKSRLQRLVNQYGGHLVEVQAKEALLMVQVPKQEAEIEWRSTPKLDSECMNISMDGAMINIIGQGWREARTVTISAVTHEFDLQTAQWRARLTQHSYRAGNGFGGRHGDAGSPSVAQARAARERASGCRAFLGGRAGAE